MIFQANRNRLKANRSQSKTAKLMRSRWTPGFKLYSLGKYTGARRRVCLLPMPNSANESERSLVYFNMHFLFSVQDIRLSSYVRVFVCACILCYIMLLLFFHQCDKFSSG